MGIAGLAVDDLKFVAEGEDIGRPEESRYVVSGGQTTICEEGSGASAGSKERNLHGWTPFLFWD